MTQTTLARVPLLKRPSLVAVKPNLDIDARIQAAFGNKVTSDAVVTLITDVELALLEAGEASNLARAQAMSPLLSMDEVAVARQLMQDAQFRQSRLEIAITKLRERAAWLRAQEEDARNQVAYDAVQKERDLLAKELKAVYTEAAQRIAELLGRIVANDAEVARVNLKTPSGRGPLLGAELAARGLKNFKASSPSIVRDTHLPDFTGTEYIWPQPRKFIYE